MTNNIQQLNNDIINLCEKYGELLPTYELVNALIINATSISLCCAPNELVGIKTIMACVQNGINWYEEHHS